MFLFMGCKNDDDDNNNNNDPNLTVADYTNYTIKAWGTNQADDFAGAVSDGAGNIIFAGASEPDGYAGNIFLVKTNFSTGNVAWTKVFDAGDQDRFPSPAENGQSQGGGGSRCLDIDGSGNLYIAGSSKQGFNEAFVVKIDANGSVVWEKFWEADASGLARGSAKAYAIDEKDGKVYVTGATGGGDATEEAKIFLLVLNSETGEIDESTLLGIDPSAGYNDRGYVVRVSDDNSIYLAGWQGQGNSGFLMKFSSDLTFLWYEKINLGVGARITDLDFDSSGNIYLAADLRGVSTYLGILKMDTDGNLIWGKQYQGESNDRNNISCLRVIDGSLYAGGRGSFANYDTGLFGDACLLKMDLSGNLQKVYNYYTGPKSEDVCGERVEAIFKYNGKLYLAGEAWPEYTTIKGSWYMPVGNITDLLPSVTKTTTMTIDTANGVFATRNFSVSSISQNLFDPADGTKGSADILIHEITEE